MHHGIYSRYKADGSDNPAWINTVAMLTALLNDETQPPEDMERASEILKWSVERAKTLDPEVAAFLNELDCGMLWENPADFLLRDVTVEGKTTRQVVCLRDFTSHATSTTKIEVAPVVYEDTEI